MTDTFTAVIRGIKKAGPNIYALHVDLPGGPVSWRAGQYMELSLPGLPDRAYSIASAPHHGQIEFHILDAGTGGMSAHLTTAIEPGQTLTLRGPFGQATPVPGDRHPVLLVAGGMGVPPMKAIAESLLHHDHPADVFLYWGVRKREELYLLDCFTKIAQDSPRFHFATTCEQDDRMQIGDAITRDFTDLSGMRIYLAGSPGMVAGTLPALHALGAHHDMIHGDDILLQPAPRTQARP